MAGASVIIKALTAEERDQCLVIRREVFVEEQSVPLALEIDEKDESCDHYLLMKDNAPIATARAYIQEDVAIIGRVAVRKAYRKAGLGVALMEHILADIRRHGAAKSIELGAQVDAVAFYERFGFEAFGEVYDDAGIPHLHMRLKLG